MLDNQHNYVPYTGLKSIDHVDQEALNIFDHQKDEHDWNRSSHCLKEEMLLNWLRQKY